MSSTGTDSILDRILATKQREIESLHADGASMESLRHQAESAPPTRGFRDALRRVSTSNRPGLIAEVKKASPSKGVIRADFDPVAIARAYEAGGATCLSILTDHDYFQGDLAYLSAVRAAVNLPLLRKDFIIDSAQVVEARASGADAVLLIVAAIPEIARLRRLRVEIESFGMDALVEVHDSGELGTALDSGATLIGINNRNLRTFDVRLETTLELLDALPPDVTVVAESGIFTSADAYRLFDAGAHAMLVGESLMRASDIAEATRALLRRSS